MITIAYALREPEKQPMTWTGEKPGKEGWYWYRGDISSGFRLPGIDVPCVVELKIIADQMTAFPIHA